MKKTDSLCSTKQTFFNSILRFCPYIYLWGIIKTAIKTRKLPAAARHGAIIALLGLFCPIFWIALFTGASKQELILHATHSGIFIVIGVVIMLVGLAKNKEN